MPKYDYRCMACGVTVEVRRSFNAPAEPVVCPACTGTCQQVFTPPTFFGKGDRFEQAAAARAHWTAKGLGGDIAGHEPPPVAGRGSGR